MSVNVAAFLYLISGVLFIMALRGLSHPSTSRQGNRYGMVGMGIAIATTLALATPNLTGWGLIIAGLAIGGGIGAFIARRIAMTSMPQLVAGFHSLVGLAAVLVAAAALYAPASFGIGEVGANSALVSLFRIGGTHQFAVLGNRVLAFQRLDHDRTGNHEVHQILEEGALAVHSVETFCFGTGQLRHASGDDLQASVLKAGVDLADHVLCDCVRFDNRQCAFDCHL